ncbi:hypothetical protein [Paenibacillus xerothermodurans]|uniref:Uncharacterized protein n=1 Tax=Paenibacillus xerothermodurans TaxID=1977292 RepID=A0A2W1NAU0_PAEXE|nr:hypothetical protein [Paenibacillus xerothermodurans]PZE21024.1 hypothetical protein CBW46_010090 [Paenibacillus xerothermodurans]
MSYDFYYWFIMSSAFVVTNVIGVAIMYKTRRFLLSFLVSLFVNTAIFVAAGVWWAGLFEGFSRMFGLFGYGIAYVNIEVLLVFALFIMKKKQVPRPSNNL